MDRTKQTDDEILNTFYKFGFMLMQIRENKLNRKE